MTPLKIGYLLPARDQAVRGDHDPEQPIDQARRAEAPGFDSCWAGDSPVTRPRADPILLLEAAETIQAMFAGTAHEAADWLNAYTGAGARHMVIRLAADNHHAGLEEFVGRVLPLTGRVCP